MKEFIRTKSAFVLAADIKRIEDHGEHQSEVTLKDGMRYLTGAVAGENFEELLHHLNDSDDPFVQLQLARRQGVIRRLSNFCHVLRASH